MSPGLVPNEPLRIAFEASGLRPSDVARSMGWWSHGRPDTSRVRRALGQHPHTAGGRRGGCTKRINYDKAVALTAALGLDPVDVGL